MTKFPELPIITPDPPRKTQLEKYGGLLYLGSAGLAVLVALIAWFAFGVWSMRSIWADVYVLNDAKASEAKRIDAAIRLARDPRVTDRQKWDLAISKTPPDLARYVLAESLSSESTQVDSRAYGLAVAKSEGWPDWLRMLLARPLAYSAGEGGAPDLVPIRDLARHHDPFVALWAQFALAVAGSADDIPAASLALRQAAGGDGPTRAFAKHLEDAASSPQPRRTESLDLATTSLRRDHPAAALLWTAHDHASQVSAPKLPVIPR
ncbi:MAG: hypothetical protein JWN86_2818 [Planctomycetota bacterium]|nr:hypothetical protein [Planctomycetota bacterium]